LLSALLIALREGVEAALVVGIVLVYLDRTGRGALSRYVWAGVALAVASSLGVSAVLEHWKISQEGFEGLLLLLAALLVVTMIVWMNRVARHLKKNIEQRVEGYAQKASLAAGLGLATFVFLMVLREGAELALILRAVELSSRGIGTWIGTALGLAVALAVGLFFFQGTLGIPLGRFFSATSTILIVVAFQLALTGVHEISESMWIPSSKHEMAIIGPIVRNDLFFFVVILGAAALLVMREWLTVSEREALDAPSNAAERRRQEWERRNQRRWMFLAAFTCLSVILALTADFVYARVGAAAPEARLLAVRGQEVRIRLAELSDSNLHFYAADVNGTVVRFLVIRKPNGWGTALDACMICGTAGYRQDGSNVICRNCASAIYIPTIGEAGGCNPVGVPSHIEGSELVIELGALARAVTLVPR
jgi:high-affinity iron transporter